MVKKKRRVLEITEFKIKEEYDEAYVKKVSDKAYGFYEKQPGFEHRMLLRNKTKWFETIQWRNEDYAKAARKTSLKSESCAELISIIVPKSISSKYPELVKMY